MRKKVASEMSLFAVDSFTYYDKSALFTVTSEESKNLIVISLAHASTLHIPNFTISSSPCKVSSSLLNVNHFRIILKYNQLVFLSEACHKQNG